MPSTKNSDKAEQTPEDPVPEMKLAQMLFQFQRSPNSEMESELLKVCKDGANVGLYELAFPDDKHKILSKLSKEMKSQVKDLDSRLEDAEKNFGETEVSDALLAKANFFTRTLQKDSALSALKIAYEKAVGVGARLDIVFTEFRLGLFFSDYPLLNRSLEKSTELIAEGGDWDRRNRLKIYQGVYLMSVRDFYGASKQLLDGLATFTSTELVGYNQFIQYVILTSALTLPRAELKEKVLQAPEILQVIYEMPTFKQFLESLYYCRYADLFRSLAELELFMKEDRYLVKHYRWFTKEMRILAYSQLLESYRSVTFQSMSQLFGVSQEYLDAELSRFIAAGRLNCVIDKVGGFVESSRPDTKNAKYQQCIKQGDLLLNRVQKLGRVINV